MSFAPLILIDNFFVFPKCEVNLLLEENYQLRKIVWQSWKENQNFLVVVPFSLENAREEIRKNNYLPGTLVKLDWDIPLEIEPEVIFNKVKEVKVKGLARVKINKIDETNDEEKIIHGDYTILVDDKKTSKELIDITERMVRYWTDIFNKNKMSSLEKMPYITAMLNKDVIQTIDFIFQHNKDIDFFSKLKSLIELDPSLRLDILVNLTKKKIDDKINDLAKKRMKKEHEEYYLMKKKEAIEQRLKETRGYSSEEIKNFLSAIEKEKFPPHIKSIILKKIEQLESTPQNSIEVNFIRTYLEWLTTIPWSKKTEEINNISHAIKILDNNHFGLRDVKDRIIEYLASRQQLKNKKKTGQIICFVGPAGVGKTSLASSIAQAVGRNFVRLSLGGINKESDIRGHSFVYVGSTPGRIIQALKKSKVVNPLILMDEIDKISASNSYQGGDPAHALLEVFDPNQNDKFVDRYLGDEAYYDLSQVFFICTANSLYNIPTPLLDRLEVINLSSYTEIEKKSIAKDFIIPEIINKYKLDDYTIKFDNSAIEEIIKYYTREAGVRELKRKIETIIRKIVTNKLINKDKDGKNDNILVTSKKIESFLKKKKYEFTSKEKKSKIGLFTGLAYTGYGGDILPIEVAFYSRKEGETEFTGSLGDIMKESCLVALNYIRTNADFFKIESNFFSKNSIHIHAPEGATPKDGPSAGVALTTAILSAIKKIEIPTDIGATGEITLHGKVTAIGGLKEKSMAAQRSGLKTIFVPKSNINDIDDIPLEVRKKLNIVTIEDYKELWDFLNNKI